MVKQRSEEPKSARSNRARRTYMRKYLRQKKECSTCHRLISLSNFERHVHTNKVHIHLDASWLKESGLYSCPYCQKEFVKKGISTHIWKNHGEGIDKSPITKGSGFEPWNKGQTKETNKKIAEYSQTLKDFIKTNGHTWLGRHLEEEHKQKISKKLSINNKGGRCSWFEVEGQKVQGTWEKNLAEHMTKLKITWQKLKVNNYTLKFIDDENKVRSYTPDFLIENTHLLEVKGFWWGDDERKMQLVLEQTVTKILVIRKQKYKDLLKIENREVFLSFLLSD